MRAVNLLPREAKQSRGVTAENLPAVVGAGVGFVVVAALAGGYLSASSKVAAAQRSLDAAKAKLAATPLPAPTPTTPTETTPAAVASQEAPRLQAVSSILSQRIAWDRILREFSSVLPNDVWISSLTMNAPTSGTATTPGSFSITATTYSYDSVARMLSRMQLIPDLTALQLQPVTRTGRLVNFGIGADVKGAAAPPATTPAAAVPPPTDTTATTTSGTGQ